MMTGLMGVITFGVIAGIGLLAYLAVEYTERKFWRNTWANPVR